MNHYWLYIALAGAGHLFYLMKQQLENVKRKEVFDRQVFLLSEGMNILAIFLLVYLGIQAPSDMLTMSPITAILIGAFGSTMLSGLINTKKPKDDGVVESASVTTTFTKTSAPKDAELNKDKP